MDISSCMMMMMMMVVTVARGRLGIERAPLFLFMNFFFLLMVYYSERTSETSELVGEQSISCHGVDTA